MIHKLKKTMNINKCLIFTKANDKGDSDVS